MFFLFWINRESRHEISFNRDDYKFNINLLLVQNDKFGIWAIQNQFRVSETIG